MRIWLWTVALAAAALLVASSAEAHHSAPATYTGTHNGGPAGQTGTVEFDINAEGTAVTRVKVTKVQGSLPSGSCTIDNYEGTASIPISNHAVNASGAGFSVQGSFPADQTAQGTFQLTLPFGSAGNCTTPTVSWNATTTAPRAARCRNGGDDDGDGAVDYPADTGCTDANDDDETNPPPTPAPAADTTPPPLKVVASSSQRVARSIRLTVVSPSEACLLTVRGVLSVPGASKVFRLRPVSRRLAAGSKAGISIKLPSAALTAARRALARGRPAKAILTLSALDAAGNATTIKRTIRLRR